ncbi:DUF2169 family type VI secretion system accessory protein [Desulfovibrio inopinatus]|uniref:DUF2169 family type VI secretion system accessory protein n=1 Tax=Desulfovibrio inopinatus TaxID=102109 RepID=UPI00040E4A95|nr:DUF2169 domain-containing protein [Desulfovibrio inopinatus]
MIILKPDTLALLYSLQPASGEDTDTCDLVLACIACFPFSSQVEALLPEDELWDCATAALPEGTPLDEALPKPRAEFLVYGSCYALSGEIAGTRARSVDVRVGTCCKTLTVFGDRIWLGNVHSDPQPFSCIPITWEHAYGGQDYAKNPKGMGRQCRDDGTLPLPHVEICNEYMTSPDVPGEPAGLGALPPSSPWRSLQAGTYNGHWFLHHWPGMPHDVEPEFFLCAPRDQRLPGFFTGTEDFAITGMHPEKDTVGGSLPGIRCRVFVQRILDDGYEFEEIPTHADTLTLFPDCEIGALTFRAQTWTMNEECADIGALLTVFEPSNIPLESLDYYQKLLREQVLPSESQEPAEPSSSSSETISPPERRETQPEPSASLSEVTPVMGALQQTIAALEAESQALLKKAGIRAEEADDFLAQLEREQSHLEADSVAEGTGDSLDEIRNMAVSLDAQARDLLLQSGKTEAETEEFLRSCEQMDEPPDLGKHFAASLADPTISESVKRGMRKMIAASENLAASFAALQRYATELGAATHHEAPSPEPTVDSAVEAEPVALTVEHALQLYQAGESLAGRDLSGLDFRGQDLAGVDCRHAILRKTCFAGCNLSAARLDGADCTTADFTGCHLDGANLSEARCEKAMLRNVSAPQVLAPGVFLYDADATEADFTGANLDDADCSRAIMENARLCQAQAARIRLYGANLRGSDWTGAELFNSRADAETCADKAIFHDAVMTLSGWRGACLQQANMSSTNLERADLSHCDIRGVCFKGANARGARFFQSNAESANFSQAMFEDCMFRRACLVNVNFSEANLRGADLYKCVVSDPDMTGAERRDTLRDPALYANFIE